MRERLAELRAKCAIVKSKQAEVRTLAQLETENSANIRNVMPVKIEQANSKESLASEAIAAAVAELQSYYANFTSDYESENVTRHPIIISFCQIDFVSILLSGVPLD